MFFENSQVEVLRILKGYLLAGARPTLEEAKKIFKDVDVVVTLQLESENIQEISNLCQSVSVKWLWVPIRAVNWELIRDDALFSSISEGILRVKEFLENGLRVFVHCAAGIHRTGLFTFILLRTCDLSEEETITTIRKLRPIILQKIGKHRIELAEEFYQRTLGNTVHIPYYEVLNIRQGDFLNPKLTVLLFLKVFFCENLAAVQFCATTLDFYKIVIGGELLVECNEEFLWKGKRQTNRKEGKVRDLADCDLVLEEFLGSCTENKVKIVAGRDCFYDKEFLIRCCPMANSMVHYRLIDIKSAKMDNKESLSIYEDIREMMEIRNNIIIEDM